MNKTLLLQELQFKAIRSSGAGGQHVNKVSSKVELVFAIGPSKALTHAEKERLATKLGPRLSKDNVLVMQCDESRSQHKNKALVIKRFFELLENALKQSKKRKPTKPTKASVEKRLQNKKKASQKKVNRARPDLD